MPCNCCETLKRERENCVIDNVNQNNIAEFPVTYTERYFDDLLCVCVFTAGIMIVMLDITDDEAPINITNISTDELKDLPVL